MGSKLGRACRDRLIERGKVSAGSIGSRIGGGELRSMRQPYFMFKRRRKCGIIWYFGYWSGDTVVHRSSGSRRKWEARQIAEAYVGRKMRGIDPDPPTLRGYADDFFVWDTCKWIARQRAREAPCSTTNMRARRTNLVKHIFPRFGDHRMDQIRASAVDDWVHTLPLAANSRRQLVGTLKIVFREAVRDSVLDGSPVETLSPVGPRRAGRGVLLRSQLMTLFPQEAVANKEIWGSSLLATFFLTMASTGMRAGEVRALQWLHINWDESGILVLQAVKADDTIGGTKTGASRTVPASPELLEALIDLRDSRDTCPEVDDLIFPSPATGAPFNHRTLSRAFARALERVGIDGPRENLTVHSLRHTYVTILRGALPPEIVQMIAGHKSKAMSDHYDHPDVDEMFQRQRIYLDRATKAWNGTGKLARRKD